MGFASDDEDSSGKKSRHLRVRMVRIAVRRPKPKARLRPRARLRARLQPRALPRLKPTRGPRSKRGPRSTAKRGPKPRPRAEAKAKTRPRRSEGPAAPLQVAAHQPPNIKLFHDLTLHLYTLTL